MSTARQAWLVPLVAIVVMASTSVVAWWLIGDLSAEGFARDELDYAFEPPPWSSGSVRVAGMVALIVGAAVLVWALRAMSDGSIDRRWRRVVIVHVVDGVYLAYLGRVATAGVIGANIGLGAWLMFGLTVVGGLNAWGVVARTLAILSGPPIVGSADRS